MNARGKIAAGFAVMILISSVIAFAANRPRFTGSSGGSSSDISAVSGWVSDGGSTSTSPQTLSVNVGSGGIRTDGGVYISDSSGANTIGLVKTSTTLVIGEVNQGSVQVGGYSASGSTLAVRNSGSACFLASADSCNLTLSGLKVPVVHGSGTNMKALEAGSGAMTAGELAVTFGTAFGASPICNCTHVGTTNINACAIKTGATPTTTGVTFTVTLGGTDVVHWFCQGDL
jgi:hypothetical protein